jgi:adenylate cyclase
VTSLLERVVAMGATGVTLHALRRRLARRVVSAVIIAACVTALAALGLDSGSFAGFQRRASDALLPSAVRDHRIVVIGMDQEWIRRYGVTASRAVQAQLADALVRDGVHTVAWDVVFAGAGADPSADQAFADALAKVAAPVLAIGVPKYRVGDHGLYRAEQLTGPADPIASAGATSVGHVMVTPDPADGVVRVVPLVIDDGVNILPSLALQALRASEGDDAPVIVRSDGVQVGNRFVPTEGEHLLRLNFAEGLDAGDTAQVIPAVDVIDGKVDPARLRGKIAFVGATEPILGDSKLVPVDKSNTFPGVLVHANALNTMLTSSYLTPVGNTESVLWVALVSLAVALAVFLLPLLYSLLVVVLIGLGYVVISYVRFDKGNVMNLVFPLMAIFVTYIASVIVRFFTETRQHRRVSSLFAQYVPQAVARELEESGGIDQHVEGERLEVGLFFCDLRGFTHLSASLEPTQVRAMLNAFYELTTDAILAYGGTIMKFVGDEVFAVFGAPLPMEHHTQCALDCALTIQARAPELRDMLAEIEIPEVKFGIGLNAGEVVAAHVGDSRRRQYDVVGDTVNLGSRLCGQAGPGEIVMKETLLDQLSDAPEVEIIGPVALKGLDEPVRLVKVVTVVETPA